MSSLHRKGLKGLLLLFLLSNCVSAQQHDLVKVMSYNLLSYPNTAAVSADTTLRHPFYRTIVQAANPDILAVAELNSAAGYLGFLQQVMNAGGNQYAAATYLSSNDSERGLFYKTSKFQFISNTRILTDLRDINEFKLVHLLSGDTLRVFVVHLKAAGGSSNEQQRAQEVDSLRKATNALPAGSNFIVCGDFNIYGSAEPAYQKLIQVQSGVQGQCIDQVSLNGTWNNPAYALFHTQSPRVRSFGGGASGGMDDRFDMILYSAAIAQAGGVSVVPNSLVAYGNDGSHYNDSINRPPNNMVSAAVANAIHQASDHLPVLLTLDFSYGIPSPLDVGLTALMTPAGPCPDPGAVLQGRIRNFSTSVLDFSATPVTAVLRITAPGGQSTTLQQPVTTGTLAAGAELPVTFSTPVNMSTGGTYSFRGYTYTATADANPANDSLAPVSFTVIQPTPAIISPPGPLQLCNGATQVLSASAGTSYQWSNGSTLAAINVTAAGTYAVTVTGTGGCTAVSAPVVITAATAPPADTVFYETMGNVSATTTIAAHELANGFLNTGLNMSGSGDVRNTLTSSGYTGASAQANIFLTSVAGRHFIISSVNTAALTNLKLSFAVYKNTAAATGADFKVQVSSDGILWSDLSFTALPAGAAWYYRVATGTIPAVPNLRIRFQNTGTVTQYRVDDVLLTGVPAVQISNTGSSDTLCPGQAVVLHAPVGGNYLWNTGATTASITVSTPGTYTVNVDCRTSQPYTVHACASLQLNLHFLVEGLYTGNRVMRPRLYETGLSTQPDACDSVTVVLYASVPPYQPVFSRRGVFTVLGNITVPVPQAYIGQSFYIAIKGSGMLETWSNAPVLLQGITVSFDFETP